MTRKASSLRPIHAALLERLAVVRCATQGQLQAFCSIKQQPDASAALTFLAEVNLIEVEAYSCPRIYRISRTGCGLLGVASPSGDRRLSWSVMAHHCHRNQVALALAKEVPGFRFLSRLELLKLGFNPGHGEHAAVDGSGRSWFVLLDDYLMGSERIARAWERRHTPNAKYWADYTGRAWNEVVQRFLVVTTDEGQAARHRARILRDRLPAEVISIKPLWRV